jgi:hypothetical protein
MKTYGRVTIWIHVFLTSALDGGEWSAARSDVFTLGQWATGTHCIEGWMGTTAGLDAVEKWEVYFLCRNSNPDSLAAQPIT